MATKFFATNACSRYKRGPTYDVGINEWILWNASSRYTEEALFPAEGFPDGFEPEPMIRINGVVLPLSEHLKERHESDSIIQDDTLKRPR